jgi:metal-dependent amidase/aminoacylase/carboxypeptidase family protein
MSNVDEIVADYGKLQADQEAFYRDLHQHPELSHQERRTAGRVAERLSSFQPEVAGQGAGMGRF